MKDSILEKMMKNPSWWKLALLNEILPFLIPFNSPHGFSLVKMNDREIAARIPYKRNNLNHLKGVHACALATVGEFCAGMSLLKSFPSTKYRLILSKLNAEYLYQAKTDVIGNIQSSPTKIEAAKKEIDSVGKSMIELETILTDQHQNTIAKVQTLWQVKSWDKVQTKV